MRYYTSMTKLGSAMSSLHEDLLGPLTIRASEEALTRALSVKRWERITYYWRPCYMLQTHLQSPCLSIVSI